VRSVTRAVQDASPARMIWLSVPSDLDFRETDQLIETAVAAGITGVQVDGSVKATAAGRLLGAPAREPALRMVRHLRERFSDTLAIVSSGGVHEPDHALQLLSAGADLVQIDSGLVYGGPGLPKRVNEALLYATS